MTVHLVGAGPGDPGLLTVRALEVLRRADVVVYDRLSQASLLDLAPPAAERIDVGKAPGHVRLVQDDINALLVERGATGATVVRLKGGDPFVFARGGEEAAALAAAGVPFEIVPGITSAIAVPAYAGIPVTLRHSSTSVTIVTGHEEPGAGEEGTVDWQAVARVGGTIVVLMGVARIGRIAEALMAGGRSPDTPVAAVQWGTRPEQRTVRATLGTIGSAVLGTPSTIVVGDVAACDLAWFENRPLFGRRIVVTRAREQASALVERLVALGAATIEAPAIAVAEPADGGAALKAAVERLAEGAYDWLVLTSPNGAQRLLAALRQAGATPGRSGACASPPSARGRPTSWRRRTSCPTSCPSGSSPSRCSTRSPARRDRRAGAAGAGGGRPRRAARRPGGQGVGRRRGRGVPHRAGPARRCRPGRGRRRRDRHVHVVVDRHQPPGRGRPGGRPAGRRRHRPDHRGHRPRRRG